MNTRATITCPKCGGKMNGPRYKSERGIEWLEYICLCGYRLNNPTLDQEKKDISKESN